ncbi:glycosyltransferase family 2 protein [Winogradskyella psychrotolerans]|uniref:glycosyltransferase family 2 protein n=1 Tax=Winogradskyella psychrotolerans TaxID=1344585 RepID=UPI001C070BB1|nr:glycosyltransferase family A protein [Winogradskyella psychrotolerans]MBU2921209.1 glycosyltransferase family 2 protein [Winogradskyella psychrotolerans]
MNFKELIPVYRKQPSTSYKYKFTVFTPVYNCENSIKKVHDSLLKQTFKDFEWLVINDASSDESHEVISKIVETSPLNINYVNNIENKHKMSCFIQSIKLAKGEFLLTFDGDDECYPNALEFFNNEYEEIPDELKPKVAAVTALCEDQYGARVGDLFPEDPFYCNTFEARIAGKIIGEKWGFTKTDVLRSIIVNPRMLNYGFVPESMIWDPVASNGFLTKCVNKILRIYHVGVEGSIMNTPMTARSAFGTVLKGLAVFDWFFDKYFFKSPIFFLKTIYITIRSTLYLEYPLKDYIKSIDSYFIKSIFILLWPFRKLMK